MNILRALFFIATLAGVHAANSQEGPFGMGVKYDHVVIRGAQVFNGCSSNLSNADVLVSGNLISRIAPNVEAPEGAY